MKISQGKRLAGSTQTRCELLVVLSQGSHTDSAYCLHQQCVMLCTEYSPPGKLTPALASSGFTVQGPR